MAYFIFFHTTWLREAKFFFSRRLNSKKTFVFSVQKLASPRHKKDVFRTRKGEKKSEERSEKCDSTTRVAQPLRITSDERVDDFLRNCVEFFGYDFSELVRIHFAAQSDDSVRNFALHEGP